MRFVDNQQRVGRQVVVERRRRLAGGPPGKIARVVLDAVAVAQLEDHLQVETGALLQALRFHQLVRRVQLFLPLAQLQLDRVHRRQHALARGGVVGLRVHGVARQPAQDLAGERIEQRELLDLAVEQLDAQRLEIGFGREHVHRLAAHAEGAAVQRHLVARILQRGQVAQQFALVDALPAREDKPHRQVILRRAEAVDRRHRGDHDRVAPRQQRLGRRQAHLLDMVVDRGVLLDIGIGRRYVGLRLVVVVVGNEVLHGIVREERLELPVELGRQGLVRRHDDGRLLHRLDHVGDGVGLARAGDAQQRLLRQPGLETGHQLVDRLRLVAGGLVRRDQFEAVGSDGERQVGRFGHGQGDASGNRRVYAGGVDEPRRRGGRFSYARLHAAPMRAGRPRA